MKKKMPVLFLLIGILIIVFSFFSMYIETVRSKQAITVLELKRKEESVQKKIVKKTYLDEVNEQIKNDKFKNRMKIPLILQTDQRWKTKYYGVEDEDPTQNTLEINGCAIVSLAMVSSYLDKKEKTPIDVLDWSGNGFFSKNQGTSWTIFSTYAKENNYQFEDLEDNIEQVKTHLKEGHPVIMSVKPGYFTEIGHIMVLSGYNEEKDSIWLNNPSDTKQKNHTVKEFKADFLQKEAIRYWAIYK